MEPAAARDTGSPREAFRRLGASLRELATSEVGGRAVVQAGLLLLFLLVINGLNVVNSYVGRDFMTAIAQRDRTAFVRQALVYAGVFLLSTAAAVLYRFTEERLGLLWREWLTGRLVDRYLAGHVYYRLNLAGALANPDQRIADDVRAFTTSTLSLALVFLNGLVTVGAFSGVLWSISRPLFLVAVGYAALGSVLAIGFGRPLVRLHYAQSDREANFRGDLVHVRENAELVAFLHREPHLRARLRRDVTALAANLRRIVAVNRNLGFFTTGYNYFTQLIPILIVAPLFIRGEVEFGVISQSSMAFAHLLGAFSLVVNQFPQLSSYAAVLARLGALEDAAEAASGRDGGRLTVVEDETRFAFEQVTLRAPQDDKVLVRALSFEVPRRARVVVRVPTHGVAAAMQRAVAGIWERGEGRIVRPRLDHVLLIPERPYLPPGTLRELLVGADRAATAPEGEIAEVLRRLDAARIVQRAGGLDVERDWDDLLSLDEQRLIGLARILLAAPPFAMVADLAEGLGRETADRIRAAFAERGIGWVELGEDGVDTRGASATIEIAADGTWRRLPGDGTDAILERTR